MSTITTKLRPERMGVLARLLIERDRGGASSPTVIDDIWRGQLGAIAEKERPNAAQQAAPLMYQPRGKAGGAGSAPGGAVDMPEVMKQKASLELQLQTVTDRAREMERKLKRYESDGAEASQSLSLQQKKIKELQDERSKLLDNIHELESKLRGQTNETEQVQIQLQKLQASRQSMGDQATEHIEQIAALKAEIEDLKRQLAESQATHHRDTTTAETKIADAESRTGEAVMLGVWQRMQKQVPELFVETHVPKQRTFESMGDAFVEFVRAWAEMELHVHHMLRDLRQVNDPNDRLNKFHMQFKRMPSLVETLRDFLVSGTRAGNFTNQLRALRAWSRAFTSGIHKVILKAPFVLSEELNPRNWEYSKGMMESEEAAIGKHFKQSVSKELPDKLGGIFRRQASELSYEDYNELFKRR